MPDGELLISAKYSKLNIRYTVTNLKPALNMLKTIEKTDWILCHNHNILVKYNT